MELVTEEVVQQLLIALDLPRTNVIYAGGGNLYILAAATAENRDRILQVRHQLNKWLLKEFQGKVFLALDSIEFKIQDLASQQFATYWSEVTKKLAKCKSQKFADQITDILKQQPTYEPCKVCHRDDVKHLKELNPKEPGSVLACGTCRRLYRLGGQLFQVDAIVRSPREKIPGSLDRLSFSSARYHLFANWSDISQVEDGETVYLVNDWTIDRYRTPGISVPLLLGNYGKQTQTPGETGFISASEMAEIAQGIKRVGYLRMDVDRLGQIFAQGLGEKQTLPRLAGLSRQMSYFFKVYLNTLAESRQLNLQGKGKEVKCLSQSDRSHLLFIYAGGDDLFISGAWNQIVEFAFDIYQCFRAYTGYHPDITISGGISIAEVKFPLYQAAENSGDAETAAKNNGRNSLGLFGEVFKWDEWLGIANLETIDPEIEEYLQSEKPALFGVFPFVERLEEQLEINYSRSFVRNLLATAELQEQMLKQAKDDSIQARRDIRYFLHLPKIAYTLARLPDDVQKNSEFADVRTSLKSPYNAPYFRAIATWIELLNRQQ